MSITDLFFRPFDKARLERLVMAIDQDKLSAALVCDSEGLLDHYGRMLVKKLRLIPNLTVEVYYPNSTEALLNRFNRILEDVPIDSAVKPEISEAPDKVLVAFDSQATGIREVQLMARLVKDFPGANTRVILMLDKLSSTQYEKKIEAFGNKIIRWDIATPTDREAAVLLSESELSGMQPEVRQALANVGVSLDAKLALAASSKALNRAEETLSPEPTVKSRKKEQTPTDGESTKEEKTEKASEVIQKEVLDKKRVTNEEPNKNKQNKRAEKINALVATLFLVFVSSGVMAWITVTDALSIEKIMVEVRNVFLSTPEVTKLKSIQREKEYVQKEVDQPLEINKIDSKKIFNESEPEENSSLVINDRNQENSQSSFDEEISQESQGQNPNNPNNPKESIATTNEKITADQERTNLSNKIIPDLKPGFYVQHTARPNKKLAEELKNKYPSLSGSVILKLSKTKSQGHFFVLLSGPFTNLDDAKTFTMRGDIPKGTWIRGALGIRPLIMPIE